ncbi:MAG: DNA-3-methyladenine glycosylase I [Candidatus Sumerlaeota bacterium]
MKKREMKNKIRRCEWCLGHPLYVDYHDKEWGVPEHHDRKLFEFLVLESAQAGLNWLLILKRRENYRKAYANWNVETIANFDAKKKEWLLSEESGIVRNRLKVDASIENARRFLEVAEAFGSFDAYLWNFVDGRRRTTRPRPRRMEELPAKSDLSQRLSKDLRRRGFRFVGPVICHSYLQAVGLIDEHMQGCFVAEAIDAANK